MNSKQKEAIKMIKRENKSLQVAKRDYSKDKAGWVIFRGREKDKVKLRGFINKRAKDLVFLDSFPNPKEAREKLIEVYEEKGVSAVDEFVNLEYMKEIEITYDEMKELEENV